ncbi:MAG TPA: hypothetical protein PKD53_02730 [Chloroflexaceae bacterium]|nr:hypothetical protein [Chloroflexaceae bacterium]
MYIRWVVRKHKSALSASVVFHDAYLVESYRDRNGNPRQQTICYLGNVREIDGAIPHLESEIFLRRAGQTLQRVAASVPVEGDAILAELRQHLPALTPDAALHAFSNQIHWFYDWWAQHGSSRPEDEIMRVVAGVTGELRDRTVGD